MTQGFRILDFIDLTNWRAIHPFDFRMEYHPRCPTDESMMEVIAAITSRTTAEAIRVGCCPTCGLVGYIDRPCEADIDRYYAETWMGETIEQARAKAEALKANRMPPTVLGFEVDRTLPALEIGCGYGNAVKGLQSAGLTVHATESCPARAAAVREVFGVPVTKTIMPYKYGLITSSHVLEHVYHPFAMLKECAAHQEDGGLLHFAMPEFSQEPSMGVLLFLPHLWSFTPGALQIALGAAGYNVEAMRRVGMELQVTARKGIVERVDVPVMRPAQAVAKLLGGLGLSVPSPAVLTWQRDFDGSTLASEAYAALEERHAFPRRVKVAAISEYKSTAPIEIQFDGRVQLCIK